MAPISSSIAMQYVQLAERFEQEGARLDALLCATKACRIDPNTKGDGALRVLRKVVEGGLEEPSEDSSTIERLRRFGQRLDEVAKPLPGLEPPSPDPALQSVGSPNSLSQEVRNKIRTLDRKYRVEADGEKRQASNLLKELMQRFPAIEPIAEGVQDEEVDESLCGASTDSFQEFLDEILSVEHEIHNLGNDLYIAGCFEEAVLCYDAALAINDTLLETFFNRGLAYTRMEKYEKAADDLLKVINLNHYIGEAHYTLGLIREYQGDFRAAIKEYDTAVDVEPTYVKAKTQRDVALNKIAVAAETGRTTGDDSDDYIKSFAPFLERSELMLSDIGGHFNVKRKMQLILAYLKGDSVLRLWGAEAPRGVLLAGPPGIGKSHIVKCLAGEANCPYYAPPTSIFSSRWSGSEERSLRTLFDEAAQQEKAIIHIDEFDSLGSKRIDASESGAWINRVVCCLLNLFDRLREKPNRVIVIATTNCLDNIDKAFKRPGRFSFILNLDDPDVRGFAEIWMIHLELASQKAERIDYMSDELLNAVQADRSRWLEKTFSSNARGDHSGILRLAKECSRREMVGDHVRECIRTAVDERVLAAIEFDQDFGPITEADLMDQVRKYPTKLE